MGKESLRTEIESNKFTFNISLSEKIFTIGSCFSDVIGGKLSQFKFKVLSNPFGTTYNPISIFKLLTEDVIDEEKIIQNQGLYFHYDFHSSFRHLDKNALVELLNKLKFKSINHLKESNCLIITLGTAWVYELVSSCKVVNNCHKVPQKEFNKRLLRMKEMATEMDDAIEYLKQINPDLQIIMTVSPVRHTKEGLKENQLSKSMLRVLCDFAETSYKNVHYFPSYEIMIDDLRDYRFYKDDLIHPTHFAEQYIWEKFQTTFFAKETMDFIQDWKLIINAMDHKPFNSETEEHQNFLKSQIQKLKLLSNRTDVEDEMLFFESQLV
ncbi:MAG: GSCFA domain-containing protein [Reichenbachiella sp.]